jgi:hypothetical protein
MLADAAVHPAFIQAKRSGEAIAVHELRLHGRHIRSGLT